jgi:hypothetical protein
MGKEVTPEERQELAAAAKAMLAPNSVFNRIVNTLVAECLTELTSAPLYDLTAQQAHARMKSLEDIKQRLNVLMNDAVMANQRNKK